jgi:flagellar assembly protein FliH
MRLFIRNTIIKSTVVEIVSPRLLESIRANDEHPLANYPPAAVPEGPAFAESEQDKGRNDYQAAIEAAAEADRIIAAARINAQEIIQAARKESTEKRDEYIEQLRTEIYASAYAEGYAKGLEEAQQEADRITKQAKAYLEMAKTALNDEYHKVDRELIGLCLKICDRVLHTVLNIDQEKLLNVIRSLILMPQEKKGIKLHISDKDWEWFKTISEEDKPSYPVIIDESLKTGHIFIECDEGIFDAGIESQLEKISDYLLEELQYARLDGFSEKN